MIAVREPFHALQVGLARLLREDVLAAGGLVVAQLAQRPERVAERAGGDEQHLAVALADGVTERAAEAQVVLRVGCLAHADGDPLLVVEALAEVLPHVRRRVEDRQRVVVDRGDPRAVLVGLARDEARELRVAGEVVVTARHAARQLLRREQPRAAILRRDDELDGRRPVAVEYDDGVVVEHVEHLAPQLLEPGDERRVLAVVEAAPHVLGQHDRRHVRQQTGAYHFTHVRLLRSSSFLVTDLPKARHPLRARAPRCPARKGCAAGTCEQCRQISRPFSCSATRSFSCSARRRSSSRRSRSRSSRCRPRGRYRTGRCHRTARRGRGRRSS